MGQKEKKNEKYITYYDIIRKIFLTTNLKQ